jgi:hypothetical protein
MTVQGVILSAKHPGDVCERDTDVHRREQVLSGSLAERREVEMWPETKFGMTFSAAIGGIDHPE